MGSALGLEVSRMFVTCLCATLLPGVEGEEWGKFLHTKNKVGFCTCVCSVYSSVSIS